MNLQNNPDLLDRLAASYALGTLRGGARRRFEAMARQSAAVRTAALVWQERFASMTELQASEQPSPNVWKRIENTIQAEPPAAAAPGEHAMLEKLRRALGLWRGVAAAGALASLVAVVLGTQLMRQNEQLTARLQAAPEVQYVAVLSDEKSAASMLVTFDPKHNTLTLKRVGSFREAADKSLQLWALPPSGGPRSLGVLGTDPVIKLTAAEGEVREAPALAITLEPKGGVAGGPTGPVLFKGPLLQTPL
jgi:anti-sigma-K factor RskA